MKPQGIKGHQKDDMLTAKLRLALHANALTVNTGPERRDRGNPEMQAQKTAVAVFHGQFADRVVTPLEFIILAIGAEAGG